MTNRRRRILVALWHSMLTAMVGVFGCLSYSWLLLPDVRVLKDQNPKTTAFMDLRAEEGSRNGQPVRAAQHWLDYRRMSGTLKRAVLVSEDAAFWEHDGIDLAELRASLQADLMRGRFLRGGSTITQQLAKNLYLSPSRNPYRKIVELMITRRLEAELSKARILELYLNVIEWGDGIWGADAAARAYFGISAANLSPEQAALLAAAIINPRLYSPAHPPPRLLRRQAIILERMGTVTPPAPSVSMPLEPSTPASPSPVDAPAASNESN